MTSVQHKVRCSMHVKPRELKGRSTIYQTTPNSGLPNTNMTEEFPRPTRSLVGRVAIVSGAGAAGDGIGNGRASAILLAEAGANVVCVDMKHDLAQRTAELIENEGHGKAVAVQADVTSEDDAKSVASTTMEAFGRIDILVNVVGIGGAAGTAEEVDMVEWAKGMEINVASMVIMAKYCIPHMAKNEGQWRGSIVNMASVAGIRGGTPHLLYPTSKGAIVVSC
jgi:NAD(P)-dependent dehydrogenase (short-subunit alcohol dehydrogenase family)